MTTLSDEDRALVAATCWRRANLELKGAAAFHLVTRALLELRADGQIVELARRSIDEELAHAEIYRKLGVALRAPDEPLPPPGILPVPAHQDAPAGLVPMLHVVGMSAINETMACAFLELCLDGTTDRATREGVRSVLSDEIRHGRIGWAWLGSVGERERRAIAPWVRPLIAAQLAGWREQIATLPGGVDRGVPSHACPTGRAIEAAAVASIGDLLLPGFEHLGMDVAEARAWFADGART